MIGIINNYTVVLSIYQYQVLPFIMWEDLWEGSVEGTAPAAPAPTRDSLHSHSISLIHSIDEGLAVFFARSKISKMMNWIASPMTGMA